MDLFVWFEAGGEVASFQLAYDTHRFERTLLWNTDTGFAHLRVDDGASPGKHPRSPLMIADGVLDTDTLTHEFVVASAAIDQSIRDFVIERIEEFSGEYPTKDDRSEPHANPFDGVVTRISAELPFLIVGVILLGIFIMIAVNRGGV